MLMRENCIIGTLNFTPVGFYGNFGLLTICYSMCFTYFGLNIVPISFPALKINFRLFSTSFLDVWCCLVGVAIQSPKSVQSLKSVHISRHKCVFKDFLILIGSTLCLLRKCNLPSNAEDKLCHIKWCARFHHY